VQLRGSDIAYNAESRMPSAPSYKGLKPASMASSRAMQGNRASGTKPELVLERQLRKLGLRAKRHVPELPGKPDLVFPRAKVAVFCDGDFWHGRGWSALSQSLSRRANSEYWLGKISYNIERDTRQRRALRKLGWKVLRFWESDILESPQGVAGRIYAVVRQTAERSSASRRRRKIGAQS
jgi:DNA mismatch endonuclease, patch repair protein